MPRYLMKIVPETKVYYVEAASSEEARDAAWRQFKDSIAGQLTEKEIPGTISSIGPKPSAVLVGAGGYLFDAATDAVAGMEELQRKLNVELTGAEG